MYPEVERSISVSQMQNMESMGFEVFILSRSHIAMARLEQWIDNVTKRKITLLKIVVKFQSVISLCTIFSLCNLILLALERRHLPMVVWQSLDDRSSADKDLMIEQKLSAIGLSSFLWVVTCLPFTQIEQSVLLTLFLTHAWINTTSILTLTQPSNLNWKTFFNCARSLYSL